MVKHVHQMSVDDEACQPIVSWFCSGTCITPAEVSLHCIGKTEKKKELLTNKA